MNQESNRRHPDLSSSNFSNICSTENLSAPQGSLTHSYALKGRRPKEKTTPHQTQRITALLAKKRHHFTNGPAETRPRRTTFPSGRSPAAAPNPIPSRCGARIPAPRRSRAGRAPHKAAAPSARGSPTASIVSGGPGPHCGGAPSAVWSGAAPEPRGGPSAARPKQLRHTGTSRPRTMERPPPAVPPLGPAESTAAAPPRAPAPRLHRSRRGPPPPAPIAGPRRRQASALPRRAAGRKARPDGGDHPARSLSPAPTPAPCPVLTATSRAPPRPGKKILSLPLGALLWRLDAPRWRLPPSSRAPSPSRQGRARHVAPPRTHARTYVRTHTTPGHAWAPGRCSRGHVSRIEARGGASARGALPVCLLGGTSGGKGRGSIAKRGSAGLLAKGL